MSAPRRRQHGEPRGEIAELLRRRVVGMQNDDRTTAVRRVVDRKAGTTKLYLNGELKNSAEWEANKASRDYAKAPWRIGIASPAAKNWSWPAKGGDRRRPPLQEGPLGGRGDHDLQGRD